MVTPFFSIVIPTKDRHFLVGQTILSVLRQLFDDFEIIVVDNSKTNETFGLMKRFEDTRIRYYRTGNLSMPDNWDYGLEKTKGEYILILTDRTILRSHLTLKRIHDSIEKYHPSVVSWKWETLSETYDISSVSNYIGRGKIHFYRSDELIQDFMEGGFYSMLTRGPRGLNSCIRKEIYNQIKSGPAGRLCPPISPDFTMAYLQLNEIDEILHIDEALIISGGLSYSNGLQFQLKSEKSKEFLIENKVNPTDNYNYVPIKTVTVINAVFNDFFRIRLLVGGKLEGFSLNLVKYFLAIHEDIESSQNLGVDMSDEIEAWQHALKSQNESIQNEINETLAKKMFRKKLNRILLRIYPSALLKKLFRKPQKQPSQKPQFKDIIDFIECEERTYPEII
jgi:glycosyltransferase involved in cell wall biosynthesis